MKLQDRIAFFSALVLMIACLIVITFSAHLVRETILDTRHQVFSELMQNIRSDIQRIEAEIGDTEGLKAMGLDEITQQVTRLNQQQLIQRLQSRSIGETGRILIFDRHNTALITHPRPTRYTSSHLNLLRQQGEGHRVLDITQRIHTTFFTSEQWRWLVVLEMNEQEMLAPHKKLLRYIPVMVVALFLCIWLFFRLLTRRYSQRIEQTVRFLDAGQQGEQSERLHVQGEDEISIIQQGINTLLDSIEQQHQEISQHRDFLAHLSSTDALTELANRRAFDDYLQTHWQQSLANGQTLSLLLIDIDFFKHYNDHYGHLAGDQCLKTVADHLKQALLNKHFLLARYGGEEFAVVMPHTPEAVALQQAEQLRRSVQQAAIAHKGSSVHHSVTISVGLCSVKPEESMTPDDLIRQTDTCLYQAKHRGRNRVCGLSTQTETDAWTV